MKNIYEDYKARFFREEKLNQNVYIMHKTNKENPINKEDYQYHKGKSSIINENNYNYLNQTLSSKNKIKKSKSLEKSNSIKTNHNNKYNNNISYNKNLKNKKVNKEISKNNIDNIEYNVLQKRISTLNKNSEFNKNIYNNKGNPYLTMQNFNKLFPKPEPIPKRINCNEKENKNNFNKENDENENIYNEKNNFNHIKEDKNILYLLSNLDLEYLYNVFMTNYISFNDLFLLTKGDFAEMKIPIGPRNRILHFIYEYKKFAQNFDFKELSNFLNYYKKNMNKPLLSDINNNGLFISTTNINNVPFNCFNSPIINNFLNNQNTNDAISTKNENIEKINIFSNNLDNDDNIFKNYEEDNPKNELKAKYNPLNEYHNNDLTKLINSSKEKKYNTTNTKLKKYNSMNSSKKNMFSNSSMKKFGFSENNKNTSKIINYNNLNSKTKNNIKTISSKNLKNNFMNDDRNKQYKKSHNISHKINYNKIGYGYSKNILLKNCNNSNYLLQKFQNIDKDITKFQNNYTKIQKNTRNISERLSHIFMSQKNSKINENLMDYMYKDLEKEKIRNLNYEMNHNYRKNI